MTAAVTCGPEKNLNPAEFVDVLERSGLAARRPVGEDQRIRAMVENADIVVYACGSAGRLIGVSRTLTGFAYCGNFSVLAVDADHQGRGIGRELTQRTHEVAGRGSNLVLLSALASAVLYPRAGLDKLYTSLGLPWAAPGTREGL